MHMSVPENTRPLCPDYSNDTIMPVPLVAEAQEIPRHQVATVEHLPDTTKAADGGENTAVVTYRRTAARFKWISRRQLWMEIALLLLL
jgi:hypothetical protein